MTLEQKKITRYDQQALSAILQEERDYIARATVTSTAKQWCLKNGVDIELISYARQTSFGGHYEVEFRAHTYAPQGRLKDSEVADLQRRLKKAPFAYSIDGVTK